MQSFTLQSVPLVKFGRGVYKNILEFITNASGNVLIITCNSFMKSGKADIIHKVAERIVHKVFFKITGGEPTVELIDSIVNEYRNLSIALVIAIGGGAVIDTGKAVSAMITVNDSVIHYLENVGDKNHPGTKIPFIALPTTSGTGSEVTKNAVIARTGIEGFKKSLRHDRFVPDVALIDPSLTDGLPPEITASCGMDAIAQLIESYISTKSTIFTDSIALPALIPALQGITQLCNSRFDDEELRDTLSYASYISGITLAHAGLGICHGIAGPMGGLFPIPHGVACANLLPSTISFTVESILKNRENNVTTLKKIGILGRALKENENETDENASRYFADFCEKLLENLPVRSLGKYGITSSDTVLIATASDNKNSPVKADTSMMSEMILRRI